MHLPPPPFSPPLKWRPHRPSDAQALYQLELASEPSDGRTNPQTLAIYQSRLISDANLNQNSLCAFDKEGNLAATAWITFQPHFKQTFRAYLNGRIHPAHRGQGVGTFLLTWMEARAAQRFAQHNDGHSSCHLRCDFYDRAPDATDLFQQQGFHFSHAEDIMHRDLSHPLPIITYPTNLHTVAWDSTKALLFYNTYVAAFHDRLAGKKALSQEVWLHSFTGDDEFRPDFSYLLMEGEKEVGFVVCSTDEDDNEAAWIDQIGIRPAWRRRGFATLLLVEVMALFRSAGYRKAALSVNINNPNARHTYEKLTFTHSQRYTSYQKILV